MMKLVIEVSGLPSEVMEKHKFSIVSAVEDQVENIIDTDVNPDGDEEVDYDQYVSWDVVDG